jgi:hypothetical protein
MTHNDLHLGNIVIEEKPEIEKITYVINDKKYTIYTKFKVYIFDFDRSYCLNLGSNKINTDTNIFIDNIDIVELLCEVSNYINNPLYLCGIANIISKNISIAEHISKNSLKKCNLRSDIHKYNSSIEILENLSTYLPTINYKRKIKEYIYVCNERAFIDGLFDPILQKELYENTLKNLDMLPNGIIINKFRHIVEFNIKTGKCQRISEMKYEEDEEFDTRIKNRDVSFKSPATFKKFIANRYAKSSEDTMFPIVQKLNLSGESVYESPIKPKKRSALGSLQLSGIPVSHEEDKSEESFIDSPIKPKKRITYESSQLSSIPGSYEEDKSGDISGDIFPFEE